MTKPAVAPRPMGGFNQGFGDSNEHLDAQAMQTAVKQQALTQQLGSNGPTAKTPLGQSGRPPTTSPTEPNTPAVGTLQEELVTRPIQSVAKELVAFFDINRLLDIDPVQDPPEIQARKKAIHQRWGQLTEAQQHVAEQQYQAELAKKKHDQEQIEQEKIEKERASQSTLVIPSSVRKGPIGPAAGQSHKTSTIQAMQHERQTLGGPQGAH